MIKSFIEMFYCIKHKRFKNHPIFILNMEENSLRKSFGCQECNRLRVQKDREEYLENLDTSFD